MALGLGLEIPLCLPAAQGAVLPSGPSTRLGSAGGAEWVGLSPWPQAWREGLPGEAQVCVLWEKPLFKERGFIRDSDP